MRFGLVGTGPWARMTHGPGLVHAEGIELIGVWGRNAENAERLARELDAAPYPDYTAMLDDVDAVAFSVPPHRAGCYGDTRPPMPESICFWTNRSPPTSDAAQSTPHSRRSQQHHHIHVLLAEPVRRHHQGMAGSHPPNRRVAWRLDAMVQRTSRAEQPVRSLTMAPSTRSPVGTPAHTHCPHSVRRSAPSTRSPQ